MDLGLRSVDVPIHFPLPIAFMKGFFIMAPYSMSRLQLRIAKAAAICYSNIPLFQIRWICLEADIDNVQPQKHQIFH